MPDTVTCPTCIHSEICKAYKDVSEAITDWNQFTVKLSNINRVYNSMAEMCKQYRKLPPFKIE